MRKLSVLVATAIVAMSMGINGVRAGLLGMPMGLQAAIQHIKFETPTMPPFAFLQFCVRYEHECRKGPMFRGGPVRLTEERWAELKQINQSVNREIIPERNDLGLIAEKWLINPDRGDCNDYAVSKRHELLGRGWPARSLLLSEVVVSSGDHHLVLVVRTNGGDFVLDNLTPQIRPWSRAPYRWVRIQTPTHHRLWATIADRGV